MRSLRAGLFAVWLYGGTVLMILAALPLFLVPRGGIRWAMRQHARFVVFGLRRIVGARVEFRGLEHAPQGRALVAGKHQAMLDTIAPFLAVPDPCFAMKSELARLPLYGWVAAKTRQIVIEREAGATALRRLVADTQVRLAEARQVIIFPEGTRRPPGAAPDYKPGVAALYRELNLPCHLLATNAGDCWPAKGLRWRPGLIVYAFLEPIPPGLKRAEFMRELEARLEGASAASSASPADLQRLDPVQ